MDSILWLVGGAVGLWLLSSFLGKPAFWKTIQKHPEEAWAWFNVDPTWEITETKPGSDYVGPFLVKSAGGSMTKVFGRVAAIEASQSGFLRRLAEIARHEKALGKEISSDPAVVLRELMSDDFGRDRRLFAEWLSRDAVTMTVAKGFAADDFSSLYSDLIRGGCGQKARGRWAPVAIMTNPRMLQQIIKADPEERGRVGIRFVLELQGR